MGYGLYGFRYNESVPLAYTSFYSSILFYHTEIFSVNIICKLLAFCTKEPSFIFAIFLNSKIQCIQTKSFCQKIKCCFAILVQIKETDRCFRIRSVSFLAYVLTFIYFCVESVAAKKLVMRSLLDYFPAIDY